MLNSWAQGWPEESQAELASQSMDIWVSTAFLRALTALCLGTGAEAEETVCEGKEFLP